MSFCSTPPQSNNGRPKASDFPSSRPLWIVVERRTVSARWWGSQPCMSACHNRRSLDIFLGELGPALSTAMWMELSMVKSGAVAAVWQPPAGGSALGLGKCAKCQGSNMAKGVALHTSFCGAKQLKRSYLLSGTNDWHSHIPKVSVIRRTRCLHLGRKDRCSWLRKLKLRYSKSWL